MAAENAGVALPAEDAMRSRVFFVFEGPAGQIGEPVVIELYEDLVPSAAREFRLRCSGSGMGRLGPCAYEGSAVNGLWPDRRVEAGRMRAAAPEMQRPAELEDHASLRHSEAGCVSMALRGSQFLITLSAASHLDASWQIVGRVVSGLSAVAEMSVMDSADDGAPVAEVRIAMCGVLGGGGLERSLAVALEMRKLQAAQGAAAAAETPAEASERVCGDVRSAVAEALQAKKRKAGNGSAEGPAAKHGGMWGALLGDSGEDDSSGSEEKT